MAKKIAILAGSVALAAVAPTRISGTVERVDGGVRVTSKRPYSNKLETRTFPNAVVIGGMEASSENGGFVDVFTLSDIFASSVEDINTIETDEDGFITFNDEDSDAIFVNAGLAIGTPVFLSTPFDVEGAEPKAAKPAAKAAEKKAPAKKAAKVEVEEEDDEAEAEVEEKPAKKSAGKDKASAKKTGSKKAPAKGGEEEWD